jgi:hypothetical protein
LLYFDCMGEPRIVRLPDGEEMLTSEIDERSKSLLDDPRQEVLEHRHAAEVASKSVAPQRSETQDGDTVERAAELRKPVTPD